MPAKPVAKKITPKLAVEVAEAYETLRARRLAIEKEAEAIKELEQEHKNTLVGMLQALEVSSVGSASKIYAIVLKDEPTVNDWPALHQHIRITGEFELLFRRTNNAAIKERWELNEEVPGVGRFPTLSLSITKAKGA
jgi:hypothetical protein